MPTPSFNIHKMTRFFLTITNYGQTINSSFQIQSKKTIHDLLITYASGQPTIKQLVLDIATYAIFYDWNR
ncbi:hypothetical protein I4U23_010163 [Adineta vaga]|nr:hypothetical protein I4U23_010163 [Adineta vaga]